MTALTSILAGGRATAAMLQGVAPNAIFKPGDQSVTSSTTLVNDTDLFLALPANSTWIFLGILSLTGAAIGAGDWQGQFTVPSGATAIVETAGFSLTTAGALNGSPLRAAGVAQSVGINGGSASPALIFGSVTVAATAGSLRLQWAQNTSSATATTVKAGSWLAAWQTA